MHDRLEPVRRALLERLARQLQEVARLRERSIRGRSATTREAADVLQAADPRVVEPVGRIRSAAGSATVNAAARTPDLSRVPSLRDLVDTPLGRADDRKLTAALAGLGGRYGPYRLVDVDAKYFIPERLGGRSVQGIRFKASIVDDSGKRVGRVYRVAQLDDQGKLVVHNMNLKLDRRARGKGFSTAFTSAIENYYRRSGVDRIELIATGKDGGLVWARAGFTWSREPDLFAESIESMRMRISTFRDHASPADQRLLDSLLARFERPSSVHFPEPAEIAMLAGEKDLNLGQKIMRGSSWWAMKKL